MCGIAGFIGKGDQGILDNMISAIKYRGPVDGGTFFESGIGLAQARLSIIDLSENGRQPLWNTDRSVGVVFNGEIYNFKTLRTELANNGRTFFSDSDTEVIVALYERYGEKCFAKLDGMFALALYDVEKKKIILARDRMGEKPLYWFQTDDTVVFASELKALREHPLVPRDISKEALAHYLVREYVPTPLSIFKNIQKLPPATYLVLEEGKIRSETFWSYSPVSYKGTFTSAIKSLDTLLSKTVSDRLVSDVPVGIFLSGGIDSSTIAYYAQKASAKKIKTFSIGFTEKSFDESSYAKDVADHLSTDHNHKIIRAEDALEMISMLPAVLDEPLADPSVIPTLLLSKFTKGQVTVALGGDGGDELFAGYPTFQADRMVKWYLYIPTFLRKNIIEPVVGMLPESDKNFGLSFKLKKFLEGASYPRIERHARWLQAFSKEELASLLTSDFHTELPAEVESNDTLRYYQTTYMMDDVLVKVDRASMRYALEVRAPFLGAEVVEFASSLPYQWKLHGWTTKYILKKLMHNKLPKHIVYREKKGFGIPVAEWIKKELRPLVDDLLSVETLKEDGIFNPEFVQKIVREHMEGKRNHRKKLWTLLVFQLWRREYK